MQGRLSIQVFDAAGHLVTASRANNAIVYTGRELVAKLFARVEETQSFTHIAIGTGSKPVDASADTGLDNEVFRKELKPFDPSRDLVELEIPVTTDDGREHLQKSSLIRLSADLEFNEPDPAKNNGQPYDLKEAGLFNAATAKEGTMYNRVVFPGISKTKDFKLTLIWEIIF
nr:hypothetical protein [Nodosilinea sp. LEGE 06152]